jgi:hypothetical protein
MTRVLGAALLVLLSLACAPKRIVAASATIEDLPNEVEDAGGAAGAKLASAGAADAGAAEGAPLVTVEVPEGFSAVFPVEPQAQRNSVAIKAGNVNTVSLTANLNGVLFSVTRAEYPEALVARAGPRKMLAEARLQLSSQLKGKPTEEKDVELSGHPGQIFFISGQDRLVRARSAIVQNQLYTLVVVYTGPTPPQAEAFLASLALKDPPPPPAAAKK